MTPHPTFLLFRASLSHQALVPAVDEAAGRGGDLVPVGGAVSTPGPVPDGPV